MTKRFEKAYNALVSAYFNGTLGKGTCIACAVGNIVADAQGGIVTVSRPDLLYRFECTTNNGFWNTLFSTCDGTQQRYVEYYSRSYGNELLKLTGYHLHELEKVEYAFETNTQINYLDYKHYTEQEILEDQYKGLAAVVDVMLALDAIADNNYKRKFREHPALIK